MVWSSGCRVVAGLLTSFLSLPVKEASDGTMLTGVGPRPMMRRAWRDLERATVALLGQVRKPSLVKTEKTIYSPVGRYLLILASGLAS